MSKKDKKIKKLQVQVEELTSRINSLEDFLSNIVSKGIASIFDANGFENDINEDDSDSLQAEDDFSLFTADEDHDIEVDFIEPTKSDKKKAKKDKKKAKKEAKISLQNISDEVQKGEIFEEEEEENEGDFLHNISDTHMVNLSEDFPIEHKKKREKTSAKDKAQTPSLAPTKDLLQLNGIGPSLSEKLQDLGIKSIEDLAKISVEEEMRINEIIKGFSKKMNTYQWKEQSQQILDLQNDNVQ